MKVDKQERRYKDFILCKERYWEINKLRREMSAVPLKEPYQRGWILYLDLRDDIKRRRDYPSIRRAFDLAAVEARTRDVKLVKKVRSNKGYLPFCRSLDVKKNNFYQFPQLVKIRKSEYETLLPSEKKWYELAPFEEKWASFRGSYYQLNIPLYWIEVKVKPNIITHAYALNPALEKEIAELKKKLDVYWIEFGVDYGSSYPAYKDRAIMRDKIQKFKRGEIEDITIEKIPKEYDY